MGVPLKNYWSWGLVISMLWGRTKNGSLRKGRYGSQRKWGGKVACVAGESVCTLVCWEVDNGQALCTQQLAGNSDKITRLPHDIIHSLHPNSKEISFTLFYFIRDICQQQFMQKPHKKHYNIHFVGISQWWFIIIMYSIVSELEVCLVCWLMQLTGELDALHVCWHSAACKSRSAVL